MLEAVRKSEGREGRGPASALRASRHVRCPRETPTARVSPGERPFRCSLCEKAFNQKSALQVHMKKHTGERPYRCHCCAMGFTQKSNMKLHMKRAHGYAGEAAAGPPGAPRGSEPAGWAAVRVHAPGWGVPGAVSGGSGCRR